MSSDPSTSNPSDAYERLAAQRRNIAYVLLGAGVALLAIPITNVSLYGWQSLAAFIWGAALSLLVFGAGLLYLMLEAVGSGRGEADRLRVTVLIVLGVAGLLTALLGLVLPFSSPPFSVTDYPDIFAGGVQKWRERNNAWALTRLGAALLGGLVLLFVGLVQARAFERTRPNLRRLLYGYNAILSSLLLILIVGLINLLPYSGARPFSYANEAIDWTRAGIHTLHPATKNLLAELKQPVKVYVLGSSGNRIMFEMTALLDKCRAIDPQLSWEQLSPNRNRLAVLELMQKYNIPESEGVLVVYGSEGNAVHEFIKTDDLVEPGQRFVFKGENALLNALTFLSSGKKKATVYFTQGSGELGFSERQGARVDVGMGVLVDELNRINYDTRELKVTADTDNVPEDADIVVVARPREEFPAKFAAALRDYLKGTKRKENKKGKLIFLFDVVQRGGKGPLVRTGLEALAAEYGVRVSDNRVLNPSSRDPLAVNAICDPRSKNLIARAFSNESEAWTQFLFYQARTVETSPPNPAAPPANTVENLVITYPNRRFLVEKDLDASPGALLEERLRDPRKANELLTREPVALAATISEGKSPAPIPGHEFMAREGQPRLVVFGDASWISNALLERVAPNHFNLFSSCLAWLAERSDIGTRVPPTQHDLYSLKAPPGSGLRLILLPGFLMLLGVLALGLGVWVVRRR